MISNAIRIIRKRDLQAGASNSRPVSRDEFIRIAERGRTILRLASGGAPMHSLTGDTFEQTAYVAYQATRESWGGVTVDAHDTSGRPVRPASGFSVSVKHPGHETVHIAPTVPYAAFRRSLLDAVDKFTDELDMHGAHLGVFYDVAGYKIDVDPVMIVPDLDTVEAIGAYTFATGGAYSYADGNGYWPPHVPDMTCENTGRSASACDSPDHANCPDLRT